MKLITRDLELIEFKEYLINTQLALKSRITYLQIIKQFLVDQPNLDDIDVYKKFFSQSSTSHDRDNEKQKHRNMTFYFAVKKYLVFKFGKHKTEDILNKVEIKPSKTNIKKDRDFLSKEKRIEVLNNIKINKHQVIAIIQMLCGVRAGDVMKMERGTIIKDKYDGKQHLILKIKGKGGVYNETRIINAASINLILDYTDRLPIKDEKFNLFKKELAIEKYYFLDRTTCIDGTERGTAEKEQLFKNNYQRYRDDLKSALVSSGIDPMKFATHTWRHCFARDCWESTKDIFVLKNLLRHQSVMTTEKYLDYSGLNRIDLLEKLQG